MKRIPPLGEDPTADLKDFCAAHCNTPKSRVMADALRWFIQDRLQAEPALRQRFDAARRKRLGDRAEIIRICHYLRTVK